MCRLTIVEPVGVGHRPANHLEVEPGSLPFRAFTRRRFHDKHGLVKSLQLSLVRLIQPASRRAARRAARGAAQGARRRRPKGEVESSKHGRLRFYTAEVVRVRPDLILCMAGCGVYLWGVPAWDGST